MTSRIPSGKRFLTLAFVAIVGLGAASTAAAMDFCAPCVAPVVYETQAVAVQPPLYCDICDTPALARTSLPGYYSNAYDYASPAPASDGIAFIIPNQSGYTESTTPQAFTNEVDRYYASYWNRGAVQAGTQDMVASAAARGTPPMVFPAIPDFASR